MQYNNPSPYQSLNTHYISRIRHIDRVKKISIIVDAKNELQISFNTKTMAHLIRWGNHYIPTEQIREKKIRTWHYIVTAKCGLIKKLPMMATKFEFSQKKQKKIDRERKSSP
jgi:hypothetical protein